MLSLAWLGPANLSAQEGSLDPAFSPSLGRGFYQPIVRAILEQSDGKLLIGGEFISVNGVTRNRVARLNSDGTLDSSFGSSPGGVAAASLGLRKDSGRVSASAPASGADGDVQGIAVQSDGRVLIGGSFTSFNGAPRNRIARLNSDGSLDSTFDSGTGADGAVRSILVQTDGRVLINGFFTTVNGASRNRIARLKSDGSLDGSFSVGLGASGGVTCMALQTDGRVLVGGNFTSIDGTPRNRIARLNSDGTLDTGFNPSSGADDWISAMALQSDGKVVIGGDFKAVNNATRTRLARLNSNGSLDTSFNPVLAAISGYGMDIDAIAVQNDGKLVVGGSFGSVNGTPRTRVARLNPDGTLDTSFNPGSGPDNWVFSITVQRDGRILIGGWFANFGGTPHTQIARLLGSAPAAVAPSITVQPQSRTVPVGASVSFSVTAAGTAPLRYQWRKDGINIPGATESSLFLFTTSASSAGAYTVLVSNHAGSVTSSAATLTVASQPSISTQPQTQVVMIGASVTFAVAATGAAPMSYQWKKDGVTLAGSARISGATAATLTITGVQFADAGAYSVVVTNPSGSVASSTAVLTISLNSAVSFADAKLEAAVRSALAQPTGVITVSNMSALVEVSLPPEGITNLTGLQWAVNLDYLNAERNQISDVSPLAGLTNLTRLRLNENTITNVVALSRLTKLSTLALYINAIGDPAPLAGLTNLTELYLNDNRLTDLRAFTRLTRLSNLNVGHNLISDVAPLAGLTNLTDLRLQENSLTNIAALSGLTKLSLLKFYENQISDAAPLANLPNLTELHANNNRFTDVAALSGLTRLTILYLAGNSIRDASAVAGLTNLTELHLNSNRSLADVTALSGLTKLTSLSLTDNSISDVGPLAGLTNLIYLYLADNDFSDLSGLSGMAKLSELDLPGNRISDLTPLAGLTNLYWLGLNGNRLADIEPLSKLTELNELYLADNAISDIAPFGGMPKLGSLYLSGNWLTNLTALTGLTNLTKLDVKGNLLDVRDGSTARAALQTLVNRGVQVEYEPQNALPRISPIADQITSAGAATAPIAFKVASFSTPAGQLTVRAVSSDASLVPEEAFVFGGSGADRTVTITPTANKSGTASITVWVSDGKDSESASFVVRVIPPQAMAIDVQGSGFVARTPDKAAYALGEQVTLTAAPGRYYAFSHWLDGRRDNPRAVTVGSTNRYTAIFTNTVPLEKWVLQSVTIEVPLGTPKILVNGQLTVGGLFNFASTNPVQVAIQTSFTSSTILYTLDGSDPVSGGNYTAPFNVSHPVTIRAVAFNADFTKSVEADPIYSFAASTDGGGSMDVVTPVDSTRSNGVVRITATPNAGWTFLKWGGDAGGTNSTTTVNVDRPKSVRAVFGTPIATTVAGSGSIALSPAAGPYAYGSSVRFSAVPNAGNYFRFWGGAASGNSSSPLDLVITNANPTISAIFAALPANTFSLTTLVNGNGTVSRSPSSNNYTNGNIVTLSASPAPGHTFAGWSGEIAGSQNPLNLTMNASKTITATFAFTSAPTVSLTSPTNGATFATPANITLTAVATDPDGTVSKVEFFYALNSQPATLNLIGENLSSPFSVTWTNASPGNYILTAKATDNLGSSAMSDAISVTVTAPLVVNNAPAVRILQPQPGAAFGPEAMIQFEVEANDSDGAVTRVEFYRDGAKLGETAAPPHRFVMFSLPPGKYVLSAKAYDDRGAVTASGDVEITVAALQPQTIIFATIPDQVLTNAPLSLLGLASASSGLPVTFSLLSGPARLTNGLVALTGVGKVMIRATQSGNSTFLPAPNEDGSFNVSLPSIPPVYTLNQGIPTTIVPFAAGVAGLQYAITQPPASSSGMASVDGQQIVYTPNPAYVGTTDFRYRINDTVSGVQTDVQVILVVQRVDPIFRLEKDSYAAGEGDGVVLIAIRKNISDAGRVLLSTRNVTAMAVEAGTGDFTLPQTFLDFASGETNKFVAVSIINDQRYEGNETFEIQISALSPASVAEPSRAVITIVDDDSGLIATDVKAPAPLPPREARLKVNLIPPESDGRWRFVGESHWRASGSVADGLVDGTYEVEFKPANNFAHPLPTNTVVLNGITQSLDVYYILTSSPKQGNLQVLCEGTTLGGWKFEEETDAAFRPSGTTLSNLNAGTYTIQFKPVDGFIPPGTINGEVRAGGTLVYAGKYLPAPAASSDRIRPVVTPFGLWKYPFIGEISRGDGELGSGFVVRERVVLTAAHVVFDQRTLSSAKRVRWHFQKHRGAYEPQPQIPRGWFLYEGYAAQRQTEGANSASTIFSQNLDAAALFFAEPAARGGYGGYLASTNAVSEWLVGTGEKILSGYPIAGIPSADQEKIHETTPVPVSLTRVLQLPGGTLYRTPQLLSYPGNSGGPLCVRHSNGIFYPAGIFVAVDADSIYVKGLDQKAVDLMNAAELSSITGTNATAGGVVNFGTTFADFADETGYLQVSLSPAAAVDAGAGWRFTGGNPAYVVGANTGMRVVAFDFQIEFKPVPGFIPPTNVLVQIAKDVTNSVAARYRRPQEILFATIANLGLGAGPVLLEATAGSQLPVRFEVVAGPARLSGNSLVATGLGRVTVRAVQDGNQDFVAAFVERSFEVLAGSQTRPQLSFSPQTGLTLTGKIGTTYLVEVTDALGDRPVWTALTTVTLTNSPATIPNTQPAIQSARFYRAVVP